jgi:hypothetical protein
MTLEEIDALVAEHGSHRAAARKLGIAWSTFWDMARRAEATRARTALSATTALVKRNIEKPKRGKVVRFIFSSAQDGTDVDESFLKNLEAYADYMGADIRIGGYTYNKSLFENHANTQAEFHTRVKPYLCNVQLNVGDKLLFCGEINTRPTVVNPLSGFETYTRDMWGVYPHPRVCLQSVATMFNEPAKQIMTTGTVTKPNYIPLNVGFKAEFHHVIGALLVEMDDAGDVFCRHLIADKNGGFQDLDHVVSDGVVTMGHAVTAITWGDIHFENIDPAVQEACWGEGGVLDTLVPRYQFFHDTIDFNARNHHNIHDPYHRFDRWRRGLDNVEKDIARAAEFLAQAERPNCLNLVVESNHDLAFRRWLKEADYRSDPVNAVFFLSCQKRVYDAMNRGDDMYSVFEDTIRSFAPGLRRTEFLRETDSFVICKRGKNGIENALHGHRGANGAKGHFKQFAKMGPKANVAHTHSPGIFEGIYCAGTSSKLDLGYNRGGLSSWAHAHILTYPNGKRIILTMQGGKWFA